MDILSKILTKSTAIVFTDRGFFSLDWTRQNPEGDGV